jgi:hypothetical protein
MDRHAVGDGLGSAVYGELHGEANLRAERVWSRSGGVGSSFSDKPLVQDEGRRGTCHARHAAREIGPDGR